MYGSRQAAHLGITMGKSFQDYIPEFRILRLLFHRKSALKMLNYANYNGFYNLVLVYYKTNDHLNLKLLIFCRYTACLRFDFLKFRILQILNFSHVLLLRPSSRVLDSRPRGRGFEPHWRHCVVSLSKNINPRLVLVQPRKTRPFIAN